MSHAPSQASLDMMIGVHIRAIHMKKEAAKVQIKNEVKSDTKNAKSIKRRL